VAMRDGESVTSHIRFAAGDVCIVEVMVAVDLDLQGEEPTEPVRDLEQRRVPEHRQPALAAPAADLPDLADGVIEGHQH